MIFTVLNGEDPNWRHTSTIHLPTHEKSFLLWSTLSSSHIQNASAVSTRGGGAGARAAPPEYYPLSTSCKVARRSSIASLLGRSSKVSSTGKRRRQDADDDNDADNDDDDNGDNGHDDVSDASLPSKKPKLEDHDAQEAVNIDDIQDPERLKAYLNDALVFITKLGVAKSELSSPPSLYTHKG